MIEEKLSNTDIKSIGNEKNNREELKKVFLKHGFYDELADLFVDSIEKHGYTEDDNTMMLVAKNVSDSVLKNPNNFEKFKYLSSLIDRGFLMTYNSDTSDFISNTSLYKKKFDDFKYIINIVALFSFPSNIDKYFNNREVVNIKDFYDGDTIKSRKEIEEIIKKWDSVAGKDDTKTSSGKDYSFTDLYETNKSLKKYKSIANALAMSFIWLRDDYKELGSKSRDRLLSNMKKDSKLLNSFKSDDLYNEKVFSNLSTNDKTSFAIGLMSLVDKFGE